jgi:hypothetical protein
MQRSPGLLRFRKRQDGRCRDLTKLSGEDGLDIGPQSKIHAKFGEGKDGRIYFATHGGWWFDYARFATQEGYPGSHYMAYDPRTGQVQDFGLGPRFEGMNTGRNSIASMDSRIRTDISFTTTWLQRNGLTTRSLLFARWRHSIAYI